MDAGLKNALPGSEPVCSRLSRWTSASGYTDLPLLRVRIPGSHEPDANLNIRHRELKTVCARRSITRSGYAITSPSESQPAAAAQHIDVGPT